MPSAWRELLLLALPTQAQTRGTEALCAGKGTVEEDKPIPPSIVAFVTELYGEDAQIEAMEDGNDIGDALSRAIEDTRGAGLRYGVFLHPSTSSGSA